MIGLQGVHLGTQEVNELSTILTLVVTVYDALPYVALTPTVRVHNQKRH